MKRNKRQKQEEEEKKGTLQEQHSDDELHHHVGHDLTRVDGGPQASSSTSCHGGDPQADLPP